MSDHRFILTRPVFLIGFMGAGKSSVMRRVARMAGVAAVDADTYLERSTGRTIASIFAEEGEGAFRTLEAAMLDDLSAREPMIISCGGGVVTTEAARQLLNERGYVVLLSVTPEEAAERIGDTSTRPLFSDPASVRALWEARQPLYESVADVVIETGGRSQASVAFELRDHLLQAGVLRRADDAPTP